MRPRQVERHPLVNLDLRVRRHERAHPEDGIVVHDRPDSDPVDDDRVDGGAQHDEERLV